MLNMFQRLSQLLFKDTPLLVLLGLSSLCYIPMSFLNGSSAHASLEIYSTIELITTFYDKLIYLPYNIGRPIYEIIAILIYPFFGIKGLSILTALISIITLFILNQLLVHLNIKHRYFIIASVAFHPWVWINATTMIENNWALLFGILGIYHFFKKNDVLAILFLSFAIGTRLGFFIFPLSLMILSFQIDKKQFKRFFGVGSIAWLLGGLYYLPGLNFYDWNVMAFLGSGVDPRLDMSFLSCCARLVYKFFYLFGLPFWAIFGISFFRKQRKLNLKPMTLFFKLSIIIIIFQLLLFLKYPYHIDYLIPMLPFLLLFFSYLFDNKKILWSLFIGILMLNIINFNILKPNIPNMATSATWGFWIEKGPLVNEISQRLTHINSL